MAFKPNYNQQRAERSRLKQAKKDTKLRAKEDARERRRVDQETPSPSEAPDDEVPLATGTEAARTR